MNLFENMGKGEESFRNIKEILDSQIKEMESLKYSLKSIRENIERRETQVFDRSQLLEFKKENLSLIDKENRELKKIEERIHNIDKCLDIDNPKIRETLEKMKQDIENFPPGEDKRTKREKLRNIISETIINIEKDQKQLKERKNNLLRELLAHGQRIRENVTSITILRKKLKDKIENVKRVGSKLLAKPSSEQDNQLSQCATEIEEIEKKIKELMKDTLHADSNAKTALSAFESTFEQKISKDTETLRKTA